MNPYRALPPVDDLLAEALDQDDLGLQPRSLVLAEIRRDLDLMREAIRDEALDGEVVRARYAARVFLPRLRESITERLRATYVRALNGTGVILHTGLGRAVLPKAARAALTEAAGFAILEVDRESGLRNRREDGVAALLREVCDAPAATVVNNNAAATMICLAALAAGREVIVARGQLVEIGGSFRIPEVMEQSGAKLVEVGATNKVHLRDYENAINERTGLILKVHTSNYQVVGFTGEVSGLKLAELAKKHSLPFMDDLGSGSLIDLAPFGLRQEPTVQASLRAGAGVVTFSGDKLLGGPQAGLVVGDEDLVATISQHPLYRAMRPDKLTLAALEATLALYRDRDQAIREIPALQMISAKVEELEARGQALIEALGSELAAEVSLLEETSCVGGGSYAVDRLPTRVLAVVPKEMSLDELSGRLRRAPPALFSRIKEGRLLLDLRSLLPAEDALVLRALRAQLSTA